MGGVSAVTQIDERCTTLVRDLAHPVLARLRLWYETHLPRLLAAR